jgi:hypothetical protein
VQNEPANATNAGNVNFTFASSGNAPLKNNSGAPTLVIIKPFWDTVPLLWSGVLDKIPNRNILNFV